MPEHKLVLEMEIYGVSMDGCTLEASRERFMEHLKKEFGMETSTLPLY